MMKRLKENAMLIILCIVIICCTVSINKKLNNVSEQVENMNYNTVLGGVNDTYKVLEYIEGSVENMEKNVVNIMEDTERIRQDVDDIGYKLGI